MSRKSLFLVSTIFASLPGCGGGAGIDDETPGAGTVTSSAALADPATCITATSSTGFINGVIGQRSGIFTVEFDATPATQPSDAIFGLSSGLGNTYSNLAAIVRFNPAGTIDVRNGSGYAADGTVYYTAGATYHFVLDINTITHQYSVRVSGLYVNQVLATNYGFRTEQAGVAALDHYAVKVDTGGSLGVCGVTVAAPGNCGVAAPGKGFANTAFSPQATFFTASFTATPGANGIDGVTGFSGSPATAFANLATAVRFNPSGNIDVRNATDYTADVGVPGNRGVPYTGGQPYTFHLLVDVLGHSYTVMQDNTLLAHNYAFRSTQATVASLGNRADIVDSLVGPLTVCGFQAQPSNKVLYVHDALKYGFSASERSLAAQPNGRLLIAEQSRTLTLDAQGNLSITSPHGGSIEVDGAGNIYLAGTFQGTYDGGGGPLVSAGGSDVYVSKYDATWHHLWTRRFGAGGDDFASSLTVGSGGDLAVLAGPAATSENPVGPQLLRLNPDGTTAWSVPATTTVMALDPTGNTLLVEAPSRSLVISKLSRSGAVVWKRQFEITSGGASVELIRSDPSGDAIFTGTIEGTIDFGGPHLTVGVNEDGHRAYVAKLDSSGNFRYATSGSLNTIADMATGPSGNAFISGRRWNPDRAIMNEFDANGAWVTERTGVDVVPPFEFGSAGSIATDSSGNVYWEISARTGMQENLGYLVKLAP